MCRLQKICDLRGWPAGSEKNTETHEVMLKIWEGLRSKADKDNDGQVSVAFSCSITIIIIALCQLEFVFARPQKNAYKILRCQLLLPSLRWWLFVLLWHSNAEWIKRTIIKIVITNFLSHSHTKGWLMQSSLFTPLYWFFIATGH